MQKVVESLGTAIDWVTPMIPRGGYLRFTLPWNAPPLFFLNHIIWNGRRDICHLRSNLRSCRRQCRYVKCSVPLTVVKINYTTMIKSWINYIIVAVTKLKRFKNEAVDVFCLRHHSNTLTGWGLFSPDKTSVSSLCDFTIAWRKLFSFHPHTRPHIHNCAFTHNRKALRTCCSGCGFYCASMSKTCNDSKCKYEPLSVKVSIYELNVCSWWKKPAQSS